MFSMRVDRRGLEQRLRRMATRSPQARRQAAVIMVGAVVEEVARTARRDTNRFVRGWIEAGNAAGVTRLPVPSLSRSSWHERILKALRRQEAFWGHIVARYEREGRVFYKRGGVDRGYAKAVKKLDRAREELEKFGEAPSGAVIGINIFGSSRQHGDFVSVRSRIYGGTGRVVDTPAGSVVVLVNREAHASIVESRDHTMAIASRAFKGAGLRRGGRAWLAAIKKAEAAAGRFVPMVG